MGKIITVNDINSTKFYQLPKAFFHNPIYTEMKNESKIAYSILKDLLELSIKNNWINEKNEVYVKLSRKKLMQYLNIKGKEKMTKIMKELIKKELIVEKQVGLKKCNEIYICIPDELNKVYNDDKLLEHDENITKHVEKSLKFENRNSRSSKIETQEVRKSKLKKFENRTHTKTNITKTNITKTNNNNSNLKNTENNVVVNKVKDIFLEDITDKEAAALLASAKNNLDLIQNKYILAKKKNNISNLVGWIISALKKDYKDLDSSKSTNTIKKSKFNNYKQRDCNYSKLEKMLLGWDKSSKLEDCYK